MGAQDRPQCHFDIEINREPVGRIMFQLFSDICPKTCKNFLCLCSGEKGLGKTTGKKLCYKGSTFHRVVKNFMIQGGDFSEGNGKGGESIYGGYFKDENFILKHDRAFLLSMANRGKHTNGSQFFITTKPAPHLDGVHVVFGLVISGFEVIEQIENLKTDAASRPYADVRVIDCGVLATKSAKDVFEKKRKKPTHSEESDSSSNSSSSSESSSESEVEQERIRRRKRKRRPKVKHSKKRRKEASSSEEPRSKHTVSPKGHSERSDTNGKRSVDSSAKREKPVVRPEEIPPVPENRFLLRRDMPLVTVEPEPKIPDATPTRYHTPPRSRSCSESDDDDSSETPPHWKEEMQRLRAYRPPSGEKWSKGDKLSDPCSSRWDERSLSQRSRSWSYNGYYSDLSTARHSDGHHKKHRKEKKVKHKKKAKKQKHCRRHKQTKKRRIIVLSDVESSKSSTRRMKPSGDRERRSRSSSLTSHRSSKRDWSKSDKDDQSSSTHSSRDSYRSKSHSQSYSRGSSRSRTPSKSLSRSRSRSKSRSSSKSGHQRTASESPRRTASQLSENKPIKTEPLRAVVPQNENVIVQPPVVAENIPVIPLSDSPPPSRWKPGQKPWKPSYERIQEMKAKTTHLLPIQSTYSLASVKETGGSLSYHKREKTSESDRSAYSKYSDRSSGSSLRSRSRSSRSRSYSRSYSRSRSAASSRSRSRSPSSRSHSRNRYSGRSQCSRSSSYSSVSSDAGRRAKRKPRSRGKKNSASNKRHSSSSEKTLHSKYVKGRDKSSCQRKYSESRSSLDYSSDSERSSVQVTQSTQGKGKQVQVEMNNKQEKNRDGGKSKPGRERPCSKRTRKGGLSDHFRNGGKPKRKNYAESKWDSESNSERDVTKNSQRNSRPSSDKEEGEATSDSESELVGTHSKAKPAAQSSARASRCDGDDARKSGRQRPSASDSEGSCRDSEHPGGKLRKRKHGSKENLKREHTKKVKEKTKGKKDKKHKAPKRKQAFHWQPPLEFGEEEEEEVNEKQVTQESQEKKQVSENSETTKENVPETERPCEGGRLSGKLNMTTMTTSDAEPLASNDGKLNTSPTPVGAEEVASSPPPVQPVEESIPSGLEDVFQADDNMEICTPDRSSPAKVEGASPLADSRLDVPEAGPVKQEVQAEHPQAEAQTQDSNVTEGPMGGEVGKVVSGSVGSASAVESTARKEVAERGQLSLLDNKWKPLQGAGHLVAPAAVTSSAMEGKALTAVPEVKPQGLRIEIKSKNKVRPGSLFDEVRKTARLNRRPRNQESSSDEQTPSRDGDSQSRSPSRSRSKSETKSRHRTRSVSYSHSRSRSRSSTSSYRSRSYSRSRSRGWYSRGRTRSRSSSSRSYKSHRRTAAGLRSFLLDGQMNVQVFDVAALPHTVMVPHVIHTRTSSRSRSRSSSYDPHSRSSRSYTYDSYDSRSRSHSRSQRSDSYHRGRSYNRRSRSCRSYGSDSESDRSYSHRRSPSESSRYS
ncbi:NK-tumor recognition protein isoform X3 [Sturnira hondurensis]|uniref:NK-tumor recognition protein isoform X3 n=1 Tax=Sturnira hondurensis TaxID=192404 RepID=UPI00187902F8|nr:NK-tumor recognition protein isoform X3 [Sturnira hondurensis]